MEANQPSHPIHILYRSILASFAPSQTIMNDRLLELLRVGKISSLIQITNEPTRLRTPYVQGDGIIKLHESFLSYLWCVVYTQMTVFYYVWGRASQGEHRISLDDVTELEEANKLMRWGASLKQSFSQWSPELPSPAGKSDHITSINGIFCNAIKYIMYHEVAHLAGNHNAYFGLREKVVKKEKVTEDEATILKQLETEADSYAFECMVTNTNEEVKLSIGIAILIGHSAQLYLIKEGFQLTPQVYPDIDTRLFNIMQKIKSEDEEHQKAFDLIHNVGLTLFINHLPSKYHPEQMDASSVENLLAAQYRGLDLLKADLALSLPIEK